MRYLLMCPAVALMLTMTPRESAGAEPREIIEKAVQALGGEEKLTKFKAGATRTKGTIEVMGGLAFTQQISAQLPSQFKEAIELDVNGQKVTVTTVFDGAKGWLSINGQVRDAEDKLLTELKEAAHMMRVGRLSSLVKDKTCELSTLGEIKIDGKDAVGVRVSSKGYRDINIYFDKKTDLPVKIERRVLDLSSQQEVNEEKFIIEYQEKDGMKIAKKVLVLRDGKKLMDVEVVEVKFMEKMDDSEFAKP